MTLRTLLSRLGWQRSHDSRAVAKGRLLNIIRGEHKAHKAAQPPPPPPTPQELIEQGTLKILDEVKRPPVMPAQASFNLPPGGAGYWRIAGLMYGQGNVLYAMVQLLPEDAFWLNERRFPPDEWRPVRMSGEVVRVRRMAGALCVENPREGDQPGCWMPLKIAGASR